MRTLFSISGVQPCMARYAYQGALVTWSNISNFHRRVVIIISERFQEAQPQFRSHIVICLIGDFKVYSNTFEAAEIILGSGTLNTFECLLLWKRFSEPLGVSGKLWVWDKWWVHIRWQTIGELHGSGENKIPRAWWHAAHMVKVIVVLVDGLVVILQTLY